MDLDQVGMTGPRHHLGLLQETPKRSWVGRLDELLDRHLSAEARLLRQVNGAHSAPAELALDPVLADVALARERRRGGDGGDRRRRGGRRRDRDEAHSGRRFIRGLLSRLRRLIRVRGRSPGGNRSPRLGRLTGIGHLSGSLPESFELESGVAFWRQSR